MNWLLIIIVLLLALCVVNGYRKGFLRMMYSMVSWVIMFALVTWATPYINTFLRDNTSIYQTIAVYCEQQIREKTAKQIEQEESQAERIGGMAGGKAVPTTPITVYYLHELRNGILQIRRTKPAHYRTDNGCPHLVGKNNGQRNSHDTADGNFPMQVADNYIKDGGIQRHPNPFPAKGIHKIIRPFGTPPVYCEQQVGVRFDQPRQNIC